MSASANVAIHQSQFPENVRRDLLESLRSRKINHKFHYDSVKQTQKWLALHQIYSPSRNDENVLAIYDQSFEAAVAKIKSPRVQVVGLGCGGGQKDTRLLKLLKSRGREIFYAPCDVSAAMVLTARQTALTILPEKKCFPFVCDLAAADDLPAAFNSCLAPRASRLFTFFGMIPNFEPEEILPKLAALIRPKDFLLFSANLAPGKKYAAGVKKILPQYNNAATRDWLLTFLFDLGIENRDGELRFGIESRSRRKEAPTSRFDQRLLTSSPTDTISKRITANFHFNRARQIKIDDKTFNFRAGEKIRLFFSYRHTPELVRTILAKFKLEVCGQWVAKSGEEGVFLCRKN
jgi:uncharacterized SAM-dependent methyltransferase